LWAVRPPTQNSAEAKKLGGDQLSIKARLVRANNQWGMKKKPTDQSFTLCDAVIKLASLLFLVFVKSIYFFLFCGK